MTFSGCLSFFKYLCTSVSKFLIHKKFEGRFNKTEIKKTISKMFSFFAFFNKIGIERREKIDEKNDFCAQTILKCALF